MPKHWVGIVYSGGNPHDDLFGLKQEVYRAVRDGNGGLEDLLWRPGTDTWFVVIHATAATNLERIVAGLAERGYKPEVVEEYLHTTEERALRDAGES